MSPLDCSLVFRCGLYKYKDGTPDITVTAGLFWEFIHWVNLNAGTCLLDETISYLNNCSSMEIGMGFLLFIFVAKSQNIAGAYNCEQILAVMCNNRVSPMQFCSVYKLIGSSNKIMLLLFIAVVQFQLVIWPLSYNTSIIMDAIFVLLLFLYSQPDFLSSQYLSKPFPEGRNKKTL